jgi:2-polyprenyl-3-methyl-5-hydroxy-6-metoxy-1,4-benzoquinol methylase
MLETVWIDCNVCGADAFRGLSKVDDWQIGKCGDCGLIYVNPIPFFEAEKTFSKVSREFQYTEFQRHITPAVREHDKAQMRRQFGEIARMSGRSMESGKLLDIGCGSGSSVQAAVDLGWDAIGIDIDPELIELGRKTLGADIRCVPLLESELEGNQFDFIRLRDVIEHLPNPYDALMEVKRLLVPGGFVHVATPNEGSLVTQLRLFLGGKRDKVATVAPPHHIHGFAPKTLRRLFDRVGFKTCMVKTATPVDPLYVTARNMESAKNKMHVAFWRLASAIGMGSMLVAWARKER